MQCEHIFIYFFQEMSELRSLMGADRGEFYQGLLARRESALGDSLLGRGDSRQQPGKIYIVKYI